MPPLNWFSDILIFTKGGDVDYSSMLSVIMKSGTWCQHGVVSLDMLAVVKKLAELRGSCRHARQAQNADEDWDTLD